MPGSEIDHLIFMYLDKSWIHESITWFSCTLISHDSWIYESITWFSCTLISHEFMNSWKHESCRHKCLVVKLISLSRFLKVWRHTWFPNLQCNLVMLQNGVFSHHYLNFASPDLHAPWWVMNSWIHENMKVYCHTFILPI